MACSGDKDDPCLDADGDGYGLNCDLRTDCRDNDPDINPGAPEVCDNDLDDDCDNDTDEGCGGCTDGDSDTYGEGCAAGPDCDDGNAAINPGATEICNQADDDCDGATDEDDVCGACIDADSDSYGVGCAAGTDCDDGNPNVNPGATEICNQIDDDCDDATDEDDVCPTCTDTDGDTYGAACAAGPDCDDNDPNINPVAAEVCDGVDNDCDDQTDEDGVCPDCVDNDGDTYGENCAAGSDCDDSDPNANPGETENPRNNKDDDCDSEVDEVVASPFAPALVFNEVLLDGNTNQDANGDGDIDATEDEFVEIVNVSANTVDLSDWTIWDSDQPTPRHIFPADFNLPSGEAVVVFGGGTAPDDATGVQFLSAINHDAGMNFGLGMNNAGDVVTLYDEQMREVIVFAYGDEGIIVAIQDESITRNPDTSGDFAAHTTASGDPDIIFSPGTKIDGASFP